MKSKIFESLELNQNHRGFQFTNTLEIAILIVEKIIISNTVLAILEIVREEGVWNDTGGT